jgi:N utilization substance protein A
MNGEILRLVDTIHRDKDIEKEIIFQGIEAALLSAVKKKLGESDTIRVVIDRVTGDTRVVEEDKVVLVEDLGRLAALTGKQVLFQRIREAERDKIYAEFEDKLGKLVTGVVQRVEGPNLIINLGKVEGILPRGEQSPGEKFRMGERIKVVVKDVKKNTSRVKITLSRTSPMLVKALFELEVPEIAEKVIEIMEIVREPGYRTKIAVTTYDHNVDCVGACVGVRGSRIKNIVDELFGEKIDIVRWNESIEVLIMNALKPAEITSMDLDYEAKKAVVYVKPDQQSLAIGKRGQNVRLASKLSKWDLDIVTVSEADIEKLRKEGIPQGETGKAPERQGEPSAAVSPPAEGTPAAEGPPATTAPEAGAATGSEAPPESASGEGKAELPVDAGSEEAAGEGASPDDHMPGGAGGDAGGESPDGSRASATGGTNASSDSAGAGAVPAEDEAGADSEAGVDPEGSSSPDEEP